MLSYCKKLVTIRTDRSDVESATLVSHKNTFQVLRFVSLLIQSTNYTFNIALSLRNDLNLI